MNNRSLSLENNNQYILTFHVQAPYKVRIINQFEENIFKNMRTVYKYHKIHGLEG